jgi:acetyl-CoA synthetase
MNKSKNIAYLCTREKCELGYGDQAAYKWILNDFSENIFTYQQIENASNRIANVLKKYGIHKGERVSIFLPKTPELIDSFFGILKNEAVACILFSTFGESALYDRLSDSETRIVITKTSLLKRIQKIKGDLDQLTAILVIDMDDHLDDSVLSLPKLLADASEDFPFSAEIDGEAPAFIQYTSGSTGKPKGALHVHSATTAMINSFIEVFDVKADECYWCTADPAWITGLTYGVIAPMCTLTNQIHFGGNFNAAVWLTILQDKGVNVWYTAPTALRMLMQEEPGLFKQYDYSNLDRIYSVGEPLNPEVYHWGKRVFGREIYDNWFQSETGSIMITNKPGRPVKPGSMGKPLSYIEAFILDEGMKPVPTRTQGHLCLKKGWPSMFRTYINKEDLYQEKFNGDTYISGDLAYQDQDGYFWYVSRSDDVINTAGHLVGPFEVESALLEIEEIIDVAVIGVPDPILHEKIVAFLRLKNGCEWSRELELKCRVNISNKVSTTATPQEYHIVEKIPKNKSGKILRRVLKAWYEGKDPGDLSTMEDK